MKAFSVVMISALIAGAGCVMISPRQRAAYQAPLSAVPEITRAALGFRFAHRRWTRTKEELEEGLLRPAAKPGFWSEVESLSILEESADSIVYRCTFFGGGSSEVRINLKRAGKTAFHPT
jgi:hypothetical protein